MLRGPDELACERFVSGSALHRQVASGVVPAPDDDVMADRYVIADNLLSAANARLNRPLKDGFRMEGHLASARLENVSLPAEGVVIAVRAGGELKILYGM